jgi:hypothetical protein
MDGVKNFLELRGKELNQMLQEQHKSLKELGNFYPSEMIVAEERIKLKEILNASVGTKRNNSYKV